MYCLLTFGNGCSNFGFLNSRCLIVIIILHTDILKCKPDLIFSDDGKYKRIPVYRGTNAGYGFAEPFEFSSLLDLVLFYTENNLNKHSAELNTGLLYPAFYKQKR